MIITDCLPVSDSMLTLGLVSELTSTALSKHHRTIFKIFIQKSNRFQLMDNLVGEWEINLTGMQQGLGFYPCLQEWEILSMETDGILQSFPTCTSQAGKTLKSMCCCVHTPTLTHKYIYTLYKSGFVGPGKPGVMWVHSQPTCGSQKNRKLFCLTRICLGYFCGNSGDLFFSIVSALLRVLVVSNCSICI